MSAQLGGNHPEIFQLTFLSPVQKKTRQKAEEERFFVQCYLKVTKRTCANSVHRKEKFWTFSCRVHGADNNATRMFMEMEWSHAQEVLFPSKYCCRETTLFSCWREFRFLFAQSNDKNPSYGFWRKYQNPVPGSAKSFLQLCTLHHAEGIESSHFLLI